jgi:hypothetical protein
MRFWKLLFFAVLFATLASAGARAADDEPAPLRGAIDAPVDAPAPTVIEAPAADPELSDDNANGPLERVPPVAKEPPVAAADPADDDLTVRRAKTPPEDDPYAALGIRARNFLLFPSLDVTTGYTTNASGTAGGSGSGTLTVTPELDIRSDWARHSYSLTLRGSYLDYFSDQFDSEPTANIDSKLRLDLADRWQADFGATYNYQRQSISDEDFPSGVDEAPGVHDLITTAAVTGNIGRLTLTAEGSYGRTIYENGMAGNVVVDQGFRTYDRYGARLRVGYEISPSVTPFVEGELGLRDYDREVDPNGLRRSSQGETVRVGVMFDRSPQLKGEIAVGVHREVFEDNDLATLRALTVDGSLAWSPTPLTTVTFNAKTTVNPTTDPSSSGSILYDGSVDLAYAWRRNVTVTGTAGMSQETYQGTDLQDRTYRLGIGTTWKLNRNLQLTSGYLHKWLDSSDSSRNYQADALSLGLRVQR